MPLNIINYNNDYKKDFENIEELEKILDVIKTNITGKYYLPYKNFLKKLDKFIDMMVNVFEKELEELKKKIDNDEQIDNDDNISISSISDYEDESTYEEDINKINDFQKTVEAKLKAIKLRFEFEFIKLYDKN